MSSHPTLDLLKLGRSCDSPYGDAEREIAAAQCKWFKTVDELWPVQLERDLAAGRVIMTDDIIYSPFYEGADPTYIRPSNIDDETKHVILPHRRIVAHHQVHSKCWIMAARTDNQELADYATGRTRWLATHGWRDNADHQRHNSDGSVSNIRERAAQYHKSYSADAWNDNNGDRPAFIPPQFGHRGHHADPTAFLFGGMITDDDTGTLFNDRWEKWHFEATEGGGIERDHGYRNIRHWSLPNDLNIREYGAALAIDAVAIRSNPQSSLDDGIPDGIENILAKDWLKNSTPAHWNAFGLTLAFENHATDLQINQLSFKISPYNAESGRTTMFKGISTMSLAALCAKRHKSWSRREKTKFLYPYLEDIRQSLDYIKTGRKRGTHPSNPHHGDGMQPANCSIGGGLLGPELYYFADAVAELGLEKELKL